MSTWHDESIACPHCRATQTVKVATGLHISRLPHIRERVLRGELHRFACTACAGPIEVRQRMIYTDFDRGHWIEVRPPDDIAGWREHAPACEALYRRAVERGAPMLRARTAEFRVRLVFGYDELREKVALWDAGLDDIGVELLKLLAIRHDPSIVGVADRLLVREVGDGALAIDRHTGEAIGGSFELASTAAELVALRSELEAATGLDPVFVSINTLIGRYAVTAS